MIHDVHMALYEHMLRGALLYYSIGGLAIKKCLFEPHMGCYKSSKGV